MASANGSALSPGRIKAEGIHVSGDNVSMSQWSKSPAAYDFRSDTLTTPTIRMLEAISGTTLQDDVYQEDHTTNSLEEFVAELTGKEAALFVLSGTMGNQVSIRAHLPLPPASVVCDSRCHIACWEAGGISALTGASLIRVLPANGRHLTLEEVQENCELDTDVHLSQTKLISLENTLNGMIMPLSECRRISKWARQNKIQLHLDGARLWEVVAAEAGTLKEYCELFDSISLCFSKGLGAPMGSIIVGSVPWQNRARHIRKMYGGGIRQAGVVTAAARIAVEETFLSGKLKQCHERARQIAKIWTDLGGHLAHEVETNMVWFDIKAAGISPEQFIAAGEKAGLRLSGGRLVVHYQIADDAISKVDRLARHVLHGATLDGTVEHDVEKMQIKTE